MSWIMMSGKNSHVTVEMANEKSHITCPNESVFGYDIRFCSLWTTDSQKMKSLMRLQEA